MKTLKEICDAVSVRAGLGKESYYVNANDETLYYLANESANSLIRDNNWQLMRKTGTLSMTTDTLYDMPADVKYIVSDSMNADGQEKVISYPTNTSDWWYFKTHQPTGYRYKIRQVGGQIEILSPDSGVDIVFEYISKYPVRSTSASSADKSEFTRDTDVWLLDDELIILDLKWRYMSIKGIEGWEKENAIFERYRKRLIGQDEGGTTLDFTCSRSAGSPEPYTDLYI